MSVLKQKLLVWHLSRGNLNFSKRVAGISKWFWVSIKGYLGYILSKFDNLIPVSLFSVTTFCMHGTGSVHNDVRRRQGWRLRKNVPSVMEHRQIDFVIQFGFEN